MSMANYPEYGFGLVLTGNEIEEFVNRVGAREELDMDGDPYVFEETFGENYNTRYYDEDMEGKHFYSHDGVVDLEGDDMLAFRAEKQSDALKAAYGSLEEVEEEFRSKIGMFLPEGFDYGAHIGYFQCVIYC